MITHLCSVPPARARERRRRAGPNCSGARHLPRQHAMLQVQLDPPRRRTFPKPGSPRRSQARFDHRLGAAFIFGRPRQSGRRQSLWRCEAGSAQTGVKSPFSQLFCYPVRAAKAKERGIRPHQQHQSQRGSNARQAGPPAAGIGSLPPAPNTADRAIPIAIGDIR